MANGVLIVGPSGSGKTTGIRNLDPATTFIINPDKKSLPIPGWKGKYTTVKGDSGKIDLAKSNYFETDDPTAILKILDYISKSRPEIKVVVLDTISHVMTSEFMKKASIESWSKWTQFALDIYNILKSIPSMREDLTVFMTGHNDVTFGADGLRQNKLRTLGKLLDEKITIESLFTTVLFSYRDPKDKVNPYGFYTQSDGSSTAKSPMGMFETDRIPNDYAFVVDRIHKYENG